MNDVFALVQDPAFALAHRVRDPGTARPTSLLLLLHGVGGNETNLAGLAAGIAPDVLVVLPRGPLTLGNAQHAWFRVAFTGEGPQIVAEEAEASRQTLVRFIAQLQAAYGIAPARTLIAGFSQGGILSASVGLTAPASVAGFAVLSGRILPELEPLLAPPGQLAHVQALVAHGRNDRSCRSAGQDGPVRCCGGLGSRTCCACIRVAMAPAMRWRATSWTGRTQRWRWPTAAGPAPTPYRRRPCIGGVPSPARSL